jgi:ribosomal protein S18 acetylase RimI-like enzyme
MIHSSASGPGVSRFVGRNLGASTSPNYIIRAARIRDAKALAALKTALSIEAEHMVFDVADPCALLKRCLSKLQACRLEERGIFVVEIRSRIVGYIDVRRVQEKGADEFASFDLAIRTQYQGNGLGSLLLLLAEQWASERGLRFMLISVAVRNDRARVLYDRLGYSVCDIVRIEGNSEVAAKEAYIMGRMIIEARRSQPRSILEARPAAVAKPGSRPNGYLQPC